MTIDLLKQLLEIGWPAIITFFFGYLAITYITDQKDQIKYLRERVDALEKIVSGSKAFASSKDTP